MQLNEEMYKVPSYWCSGGSTFCQTKMLAENEGLQDGNNYNSNDDDSMLRA